MVQVTRATLFVQRAEDGAPIPPSKLIDARQDSAREKGSVLGATQ